MSARHAYEARCWEALARHGHAITQGTPARLADTQLIDALLKAGDKYAVEAIGLKRQAILRAARTDIGRQPTYGTAAS